MISFLKGKVIELDFTSLTVLTNSGIGYDVGINEKIYLDIVLDSEVELFIYHHITENNQSLFGFLNSSEKKVFTELIKISGVGGKVAMQILSLPVEMLVNAVHMKDNRTFEGIKGIGKKMAEKIILELKDKDFDVIVPKQQGEKTGKAISSALYDSIKTTLTNMGYNSKDIDRVLLELPEGIDDAGDILPYVIKELS